MQFIFKRSKIKSARVYGGVVYNKNYLFVLGKELNRIYLYHY